MLPKNLTLIISEPKIQEGSAASNTFHVFGRAATTPTAAERQGVTHHDHHENDHDKDAGGNLFLKISAKYGGETEDYPYDRDCGPQEENRARSCEWVWVSNGCSQSTLRITDHVSTL